MSLTLPDWIMRHPDSVAVDIETDFFGLSIYLSYHHNANVEAELSATDGYCHLRLYMNGLIVHDMNTVHDGSDSDILYGCRTPSEYIQQSVFEQQLTDLPYSTITQVYADG